LTDHAGFTKRGGSVIFGSFLHEIPAGWCEDSAHFSRTVQHLGVVRSNTAKPLRLCQSLCGIGQYAGIDPLNPLDLLQILPCSVSSFGILPQVQGISVRQLACVEIDLCFRERLPLGPAGLGGLRVCFL